MLGIGVLLSMTGCQSTAQFALPRQQPAQYAQPRQQPAQVSRDSGCPLNAGGGCPPTWQNFAFRASDGNSGTGGWDGIGTDPMSLHSADQYNHPLASGTWYFNESQNSATVSGSVQTPNGPGTTSVTVPNPFPMGTRVAINSQVTMEETAPGALTAWWSHNGTQYTGNFTQNSDGSVGISIHGSNGDAYATTVYPAGGLGPHRNVITCQDAHVMAGTLGAYAGLMALIGFAPAAALATIGAGGFEIASAFLCK